ncbi:MAG TPA: nitrilase-related carbon-nitrogen hydrolase [Ktedonobacteraceae bacterium]|nr:nitrilase-related carbon-nitrogen hydrolase [Ktedonobacteraceae bacterium]
MSVSESPLTQYKVAAIQFDPLLGEKENNISNLLRLTEEAAQHGARLIVHPELATSGYCWLSREEIAPHVEPLPGPTTDRFQQLAARYDCYIATSLPEVDPATNVYYNSMALIGPSGLVGVYRKVHSYISEPRWARDGDLGFPVWDTPLGRLAGLICMDAEFFESARIPVLSGADVLLFPTNWLEENCPSNRWIARAFENGAYFIAADRYGLERGVQFSGGSCVLDPDGAIQAYLDTGEGIVYGEVDLRRSRDKRWGPLVMDDNGTAHREAVGDRIADRCPAEYLTLVNNTYLWEPLKYHGLYALGELPPGQLSGVGIMQTDLSTFRQPGQAYASPLEILLGVLRSTLRDHDSARPDVLVLPELMLPGPLPGDRQSTAAVTTVAAMQSGAIEIPGAETDALVALATEFQISLVLGVAERAFENSNEIYDGRDAIHRVPIHRVPTFYNTILLIDPEGIYGKYRKLHLTASDRLWASPGNLGLPIFDTPAGRIGLATGYDILFPETLRVLAGKGADLVCAPAYLNFPDPIGLAPSSIKYAITVAPAEYDATHSLIWRLRATEHNVYLALANWHGAADGLRANGYSGIFSPASFVYPWSEVIAEDEPDMRDMGYPTLPTLAMMTIDTREQRTGRRLTSPMRYAPGELAGSLTGELAYDVRETIPGNVVRSKPLLRKRQPFWYLDLVRTH